MKKWQLVPLVILFLSLSNFNPICAQSIDSFGKTIQEIRNMHNVAPCEVTPNEVLTYCVENGDKISYMFENNKVNGLMFSTIYPTRYQAEKAFESEVDAFSKETKMMPFYNNGQALFSSPDNPLSIVYGVREFAGNIYLVYYTFLKP